MDNEKKKVKNKIIIENVKEVLDVVIRASRKGTSAYVYLPKRKYAGKRAKVCILEDEENI